VRLVSNARLPGWSGDVELLRVRKLDLKLARLPLRPGPLVIQNITVADPEVHLIRTEDGRLVGIHSFLKDDAAATQPLTAPPTRAATRPSDRIKFENPEEAAREAARAKLSDMFELRHFGINAGRIVYEDRSAP